MKMVRSVMASTITAAMLATSVTPAMAQGYPGGYGYGYQGYGNGYGSHDRYRRHNRGVSAGDVIAGVAVVGVLAAIIGAASKSGNRNRYGSNINSENQAADACVSRLEQRYGNSAQVRDISDVRRTRDGYYVRGTVETYDNYDRGNQRFTCSIRYGQVEDVRIDDGYAYRGY